MRAMPASTARRSSSVCTWMRLAAKSFPWEKAAQQAWSASGASIQQSTRPRPRPSPHSSKSSDARMPQRKPAQPTRLLCDAPRCSRTDAKNFGCRRIRATSSAGIAMQAPNANSTSMPSSRGLCSARWSSSRTAQMQWTKAATSSRSTSTLANSILIAPLNRNPSRPPTWRRWRAATRPSTLVSPRTLHPNAHRSSRNAKRCTIPTRRAPSTAAMP
mmetsp:Transcript_15381/g.43305  ORF Transcript_15381/g.43305 Transcript_15381/m.43305 type:complete len:216 (+) Transcript_15381:2338-2985(+)